MGRARRGSESLGRGVGAAHGEGCPKMMKTNVAAGSVIAAVLALAGCGGKTATPGSGSASAVLSPASGSALPDATLGASYTQTFSIVSGGTAPYQILPAGLP